MDKLDSLMISIWIYDEVFVC